jgi:hypothetical protein
VDHVVAEQRRDAEPGALGRDPLEAVDLRRIGDEQQRPDLTAPQRRLDGLPVVPAGEPHVEELDELSGLLGRRHLSEQLVDPRADLLVRIPVRGRCRGSVIGRPDREDGEAGKGDRRGEGWCGGSPDDVPEAT